MTTTARPTSAPDDLALPESPPSRRLLLALSGAYLLVFGILFASGADRSADDDPAALIAGYGVSDVTIQLVTYAAMVAAAVLVFYGAALRSVLGHSTRHWTRDAAFIGFVIMGWAFASFAVTSLALHHAVGVGDTTVVQAINVLDTTNFPPAMFGLMCSMIGVGLTALKGGALPKWLAWGSIVVGCMAPLGPAGFVPFMLFPLWIVAVAATARPANT